MFFWKKKHREQKKENKVLRSVPLPSPASLDEVEQIIREHLHDSSDLVIQYIEKYNKKIGVFYIRELINSPSMNENIFKPLKELKGENTDIDAIKESLPITYLEKVKNLDKVFFKLVNGFAYIHVDGQKEGILASIAQRKERAIARGEVETNVYGPQVAFTEAMDTNIGIVRQMIANPALKIEEVYVGKVSQTKIAICFLDGVADEQNVNTMRQRITELEFDGPLDAALLVQLIQDNVFSLFPLMRITEQPDFVASNLVEGKVCVMVDGSPFAIIAPSTLISFFQTSQDYYLNWNKATFIRLLRVFGTLVSVFFTGIYVAALTFHYEIIPQAVLVPLGQTRAKVPFPPLIEALFLEITIELLREAGARLPTKIGQTIGIVGGIVIGQAAVQAGFTSNILIIIVALSALASFATPSYDMGTTIRILRFPIIVLAGTWGGVGIMYGVSFLIIHLLRQQTLGNPYMSPFFPMRLKDFRDSFFRLPYTFFYRRPTFVHPHDRSRFNIDRARENKDIDE